ncbi:MAG: hypothetical protein U0X92_04385 [Anaerolineales bacterium]
MNKPGLNFAHLPTPIEELPRLSGPVGWTAHSSSATTRRGCLGGNKTVLSFSFAAGGARQGAKSSIWRCSRITSTDSGGGGAIRPGLHPRVERRDARQAICKFVARSIICAEVIAIPDRKKTGVLQETFDKAVTMGVNRTGPVWRIESRRARWGMRLR